MVVSHSKKVKQHQFLAMQSNLVFAFIMSSCHPPPYLNLRKDPNKTNIYILYIQIPSPGFPRKIKKKPGLKKGHKRQGPLPTLARLPGQDFLSKDQPLLQLEQPAMQSYLASECSSCRLNPKVLLSHHVPICCDFLTSTPMKIFTKASSIPIYSPYQTR